MSNFLTLNEGKTKVILFGPSDALSFNSYKLDIGYFAQWITSCVSNLGVLFRAYDFRDAENADGIAESSHKNGIYSLARNVTEFVKVWIN